MGILTIHTRDSRVPINTLEAVKSFEWDVLIG